VSPRPSLLWAEQLQAFQPFFIGVVFHPSGHFYGLPLDLLEQAQVFLMLGTKNWMQDSRGAVLREERRGGESLPSTCWPGFF